MVYELNPHEWLRAVAALFHAPVRLIPPDVKPAVATSKEDVPAQAVEEAMSTAAVVVQRPVEAPAVATPLKDKFGWLKRAGAGIGKVLGIAIHEAQVTEPIVDMALIAAQQQGIVVLYNKVVGLAVMAQAAYGADPKHNEAKAADVIAKLAPEVEASFGGDEVRAKAYVDSVVAGLGVVVLPQAIAAAQ